MAIIKVACPKCGQKVSGDESFFGTAVECPVCTSQIQFPENPNAAPVPVPPAGEPSEPPLPQVDDLPSGGGGGDDLVDAPQRKTPSPDESKAEDSGESGESAPDEEVEQPAPRPKPVVEDGDAEGDHEDVPSPALGATSLILGILNLVTGCGFLFGGILLAPAAVICGHLALARGKHSPVQPFPGKTLTLVGLALGYLGLVCVLIGLLVLVIFGPQIKEAWGLPAPE